MRDLPYEVREPIPKTTLFRTLQSALSLAEIAGVAPTLFRGIVEPLWRPVFATFGPMILLWPYAAGVFARRRGIVVLIKDRDVQGSSG